MFKYKKAHEVWFMFYTSIHGAPGHREPQIGSPNCQSSVFCLVLHPHTSFIERLCTRAPLTCRPLVTDRSSSFKTPILSVVNTLTLWLFKITLWCIYVYFYLYWPLPLVVGRGRVGVTVVPHWLLKTTWIQTETTFYLPPQEQTKGSGCQQVKC